MLIRYYYLAVRWRRINMDDISGKDEAYIILLRCRLLLATRRALRHY